jgi:hypothetical protein
VHGERDKPISALLKYCQRKERPPSVRKSLPLNVDVFFDAAECILRSVIRHHAELADRWVAGVLLDHKRVQCLRRHSFDVLSSPPERVENALKQGSQIISIFNTMLAKRALDECTIWVLFGSMDGLVCLAWRWGELVGCEIMISIESQVRARSI